MNAGMTRADERKSNAGPRKMTAWERDPDAAVDEDRAELDEHVAAAALESEAVELLTGDDAEDVGDYAQRLRKGPKSGR